LQYVIYADESEEKGPYFGHFYGGLLVRSPDLPTVLEALKTAKENLRLGGKVKWQKVTSQYLNKYVALMDTFFDLVEQDLIKVRVMFLHRAKNTLTEPTDEKALNRYYLLYYRFLKHAFGLQHSNDDGNPVSVRFYLDRRSGTKDQKAQFRSYIAALEHQPQFRKARIVFPVDQIAEVTVADHNLLQCIDVVLGAMQFRLNDFHKKIPPGEQWRAGRTIAKEKLYLRILARIRAMQPDFNIGISTEINGDPANLWRHRYRHWELVPRESRRVPRGKVKE